MSLLRNIDGVEAATGEEGEPMIDKSIEEPVVMPAMREWWEREKMVDRLKADVTRKPPAVHECDFVGGCWRCGNEVASEDKP